MKQAEPQASRPFMPGYGILDANSGQGLLPWAWAADHLTKARNYFIITTRPDGRPHAMPVWGLWIDQSFYFSTGEHSRKAQNLAHNPKCIVCPEGAGEAVIVEGTAQRVPGDAVPEAFFTGYETKYSWKMERNSEPIYIVRPDVVFGLIETGGAFTATATRWTFASE
jgi:nitroimidazol reductase NimA-like FMN-containing flavoprotein (pyridoxamine 5'-phosphate oxidase superfamily)